MFDLKKMLARRVKELRKAQGLTQGDVAKKAGLSLTFVGAVERAGQAATVETLQCLAAALGVEPAALISSPKRSVVPQDSPHPQERILALLRGESAGKLELAERVLREVLRPVGGRTSGEERKPQEAPAPPPAAGYPAAIRPEHAAALRAAGIASEVAGARGYRSVEGRMELEVPVRSLDGGSSWSQFRVDRPRGTAPRFRTGPRPAGATLDVPPAGRDVALDPARRLYVTDSPWAADAGVSRGLACVAVLAAELTPVDWSEWEPLGADSREVYVVFRPDPASAQAERRVLESLILAGANVSVVRLPDRVGLDDFLAAGQSEAELLALVQEDDV